MFQVSEQRASARRLGSPSRKRKPSARSLAKLRRTAGVVGAAGLDIRQAKAAAARSARPHASTAEAGPIAPARTPASPGPPVVAPARPISNRLLACIRRSRSTSAGIADWAATSKKTMPMPASSAPAMRSGRLSTPSSAATGIASSADARSKLPAIITERRGSRSIQTPAGRPKMKNGIVAATVSQPISTGPTPRTRAAISGNASSATWSPN